MDNNNWAYSSNAKTIPVIFMLWRYCFLALLYIHLWYTNLFYVIGKDIKAKYPLSIAFMNDQDVSIGSRSDVLTGGRRLNVNDV